MSKAAWRWSCTARAWSTSCTPATSAQRATPALLLEVLTPIAKSWPSEWCLEANSLAIQVHGGYGYTRDFPVEQYWRDNRLNMIHEGTHGIQALDLLGRKVLMHDGAAFKLLAARMQATVNAALLHEALAAPARQLQSALQTLESATRAAWMNGQPERGAGQCHALPAGLRPCGAGLAVAGRGPRVPRAAGRRPRRTVRDRGRLAAMRYFYAYELPKIDAWLLAVAARQAVCREMHDDWF